MSVISRVDGAGVARMERASDQVDRREGVRAHRNLSSVSIEAELYDEREDLRIVEQDIPLMRDLLDPFKVIRCYDFLLAMR